MSDPFHWPAVGLAAYFLVVAWRQSPLPVNLLRRWRARSEAARDAGLRWGELLTCPSCLALWVALLLALASLWAPGREVVRLLAASGLAVACYRAADSK